MQGPPAQCRLSSGSLASTSANVWITPPRPLGTSGLSSGDARLCFRRPRSGLKQRCQAVSTGGSGFDGGGAGFGGRGDGGDGGSDGGDAVPPSKGFLAGWEARVAADPQFAYKVLVEQIIGVGAAVVGDMSSRPYWGLYELDFVFSTLVVGSLLNFSLMWLLAPTAGAAASSSGFIARTVSGETLRALGAPGGHMFEAGFLATARLLNFAYKGGIFAVVGMAAGLVGTAASNGLIAVRKALDPSFEPQNELPNVPLNAACWATHMGLSSNLRYQLLNGFEMVLQPKISPLAFRTITSAVRTGNNILGGISFVLLAKVLGVQSSQGDEVKEERKHASS